MIYSIAFSATIDAAKKVITINPDSDFTSGEVGACTIESVEDNSGNAMSATSGTFSVTTLPLQLLPSPCKFSNQCVR